MNIKAYLRRKAPAAYEGLAYLAKGKSSALELRARRMLQDKDWVSLHNLLEKHKLDLGLVNSYARENAQSFDGMKAVHSDEKRHAARVSAAFEKDVSILDAKYPKLPGHALSMALLTIECSGRTRQVFEKNYPLSSSDKARRESALYRSGLGKELLYPAFFGSTGTDGFISMYFEYLPNFVSLRPEIAQDLVFLSHWSVAPDAELKEISAPDPIEKMLREGLGTAWQSILEGAPKAVGRDPVKTFQARYAGLPSAITHLDFSNDNVGISRNRIWVIDWVNWAVTRRGVGYRLDPKNGFDKYALFCRAAANLFRMQEQDLQFPILLYNINRELRRNRHPPKWMIDHLWDSATESARGREDRC